MQKEDLVLGAFANAFRTPDLRKKLLFVLLILGIFRLGSQIPTPGVNVSNVQSCVNDVGSSGVYSLINLFSGGALLQHGFGLRAVHAGGLAGLAVALAPGVGVSGQLAPGDWLEFETCSLNDADQALREREAALTGSGR